MGPNDRRYSKPPQQKQQGSNVNRQNHILADLRNKYGESMVELGAQDLNNDSKMLGLIRSIFSGYFDFQTYGQYLVLPSILDGLYQVANNYLIQSTIHYFAVQHLQYNQQALSNMTMPIEYIIAMVNKDRDVMDMWKIVVEAFNSIYQSGGNLAGLQSAVQYANGLHCSDGRTPLIRML